MNFQSLEICGRVISNHWKQSQILLIIAMAALASANASAAGLHTPVNNIDPRSGISIYVDSPFDKLPLCGFAPVRLVVRNDSAKRHSWDFVFISSSMYDQRQTFRSGTTVDVDAKAERIVEVMVPLIPSPTGYAYPQLTTHVSGYGCEGNSMAMWSAGGYAAAASTEATFAMSDSLALTTWSLLETKLRGGSSSAGAAPAGRDIPGFRFDAAAAPGDYRGWLGCDSVWLSEDDWQSFDTIKRQALLDWTKLGGRLHVCHSGAAPSALADLSTGDETLGLGVVLRTSHANASRLADEIVRTIRKEQSLLRTINNGFTSTWPLRKGVPEIVVHSTLILLFVFGFAVLIGPVNLFALAKKKMHMHLFWTTPALSIIASVVLGLVIILQDGFGGRGNRFTAVYLDHVAHKSFVAQEQISRTGVLLSRTIPLHEPCFITAVNTDAGFMHRSRSYELVGGTLSGDWFSSRTVQGQLLYAAQSSRARVEIGTAAGAPAVISGIGATLAEIYYRDEKGKIWRAENLKQGERVQMKSAAESQFKEWWRHQTGTADAVLAARLNAQPDQDNFFFATATGNTEQIIPTLPAIKWKQDALLYFGPVAAIGGGK